MTRCGRRSAEAASARIRFCGPLLLALAFGPALAQQVCGDDSSGPGAAELRFVDNVDGTVSDRRLRLMWMRCSARQTWSATSCTGPAASLDWAAARGYAAEINRAGSLFFSDWRLPTVRELATITERLCTNPRVRLSVFPATPASFYWTASPRPGGDPSTQVYALSFGGEGVALMDPTQAHHVRLVRDAR